MHNLGLTYICYYFIKKNIFKANILQNNCEFIVNLDKRSLLMFEKFTPLIILAMFAIGAYFMIMGMENATNMANPR
jgi:UDP-N-acetylmuramyl pentapeptide phosphotransferase/UDP-N-acetylglucosamine-1-phosphate transferase